MNARKILGKKKTTRKWRIWRSVRGWTDKITVYILELRYVVPVSGFQNTDGEI